MAPSARGSRFTAAKATGPVALQTFAIFADELPFARWVTEARALTHETNPIFRA
jgi:hypothetical protein